MSHGPQPALPSASSRTAIRFFHAAGLDDGTGCSVAGGGRLDRHDFFVPDVLPMTVIGGHLGYREDRPQKSLETLDRHNEEETSPGTAGERGRESLGSCSGRKSSRTRLRKIHREGKRRNPVDAHLEHDSHSAVITDENGRTAVHARKTSSEISIRAGIRRGKRHHEERLARGTEGRFVGDPVQLA